MISLSIDIVPDPRDRSFFDEFCSILLDDIKDNLSKRIDYQQYEMREENFLSSDFISWSKKLNHFDMDKVPVIFIRSLEYKILPTKERVIRINPFMIFPLTHNHVSYIVRFFEYGNSKMRPLPFISSILKYYSDNLRLFWESFLTIKKREVRIDNERVLI